jgi:peptide/nickel transport system substrate-binding protein
MTVKNTLFVLLATILILGTLFSGCGKTETTTPTSTPSTAPTTTPTTSTPKSGGILTLICNEPPTGSLGVPSEMIGLSEFFSNPMIERLILVNNHGGFIPQLATSYKFSNNNLTVTFDLRKGVKFHDGTDFNADAVKWNLERAIKANLTGTSNIASMEIVDDYTFRINIKEFSNTWLIQLAGEQSNTTGLIVSPTAVEKNGEEWALWHPVGTGPFKFKEYVVDTYFTMDRNDDYWGDKALVDGLKWIFIPDYVTAVMNFEAGQADVIRQMGMATDMQRDLLPKGYLADTFLGLTFMLIPSSNNPGSVLSSKEVREAIEYAIDKEAITESVFYGFSEPRYQTASYNMIAYIPDFEGRRYDPEKARQLLKDAGYPDGVKTTIYAPFMFAGDAVTAMQANLAEVGIDAKIEVLDIPRWLDMSRNGGWDDGLEIAVYGGASFGTFCSSTWGPEARNPGFFNTVYLSDELNAMKDQWLKLDNEEEMVTLGRDILQKMHDEATAIPLWQGDDCYMLQPYVRDLHLGDETYMFFDCNHVWLDK